MTTDMQYLSEGSKTIYEHTRNDVGNNEGVKQLKQ